MGLVACGSFLVGCVGDDAGSGGASTGGSATGGSGVGGQPSSGGTTPGSGGSKGGGSGAPSGGTDGGSTGGATGGTAVGGSAVSGSGGSGVSGSDGLGDGGSDATGGTSGGDLTLCQDLQAGEGLTGVWDIVTSEGNAIFSWSADVVCVEGMGGSFVAEREGEDFRIVYQRGSETLPLLARRLTPSSLSLGDLPLDISGTWRFSDDPDLGDGCNMTLGSGVLSVVCTDVDRPLRGLTGGTYTASRESTGSSMFGDLGGTWTAARSGGEGRCTVIVEGDGVSVECTQANELTGTLVATVSGDSASGSSDGFEFSAQRR